MADTLLYNSMVQRGGHMQTDITMRWGDHQVLQRACMVGNHQEVQSNLQVLLGSHRGDILLVLVDHAQEDHHDLKVVHYVRVVRRVQGVHHVQEVHYIRLVLTEGHHKTLVLKEDHQKHNQKEDPLQDIQVLSMEDSQGIQAVQRMVCSCRDLKVAHGVSERADCEEMGCQMDESEGRELQ